MTQLHDESITRAAFARARTLEPTDAEVAAVLARAGLAADDAPASVDEHAPAPAGAVVGSHPDPSGTRRRAGAGLRTRGASRRPSPPDPSGARERPGAGLRARGACRRRDRGAILARRLAPIAAAVLVAVGTGYAVAPPVRAAIDDAAGTFGSWLGGNDSAAPGRPLDASDVAPDYFRDPRYAREPRVIAQAGGYKLFAARTPDGGVEFDLGDTGVGLGHTSADAFRDHAVVVLGPGSMQNMDPDGHIPLFGIAARSVTRVELTYASGPPLRIDGVKGGFVLLAEPDRSPREVIAYDAAGGERGRQLVDNSKHDGPAIDWRQYGPPATVIPSRCQPGAVGRNPPPSCPNG